MSTKTTKIEFINDYLGQEVRVGDVVLVKAYYGGDVIKRVRSLTEKCVVFDVEAKDFTRGSRQRYDFDKGWTDNVQRSNQFLKLPEGYLSMWEAKTDMREFLDGKKKLPAHL